jgi:putative FmdB family regulatory protein
LPLYEYDCPEHGRFEAFRPMVASSIPACCPVCGKLSERVMSSFSWYMGWKFLKGRKSESAPEDASYHPEWDEAYQGPQVLPKASPAK